MVRISTEGESVTVASEVSGRQSYSVMEQISIRIYKTVWSGLFHESPQINLSGVSEGIHTHNRGRNGSE